MWSRNDCSVGAMSLSLSRRDDSSVRSTVGHSGIGSLNDQEKDITHNNTVEGIMSEWNRVVLHPSTLHSKCIEGYLKMVLETDTLLPDNLAFLYLHIFPSSHGISNILMTSASTTQQCYFNQTFLGFSYNWPQDES